MLPLVIFDKVIGLIIVGNRTKRMSLDDRDITTLEIISNQAAIALYDTQLHAQIEELSVTDGLTGLYNYRFFQQKIREEIELVKRYGHTLSLAIMDIDYFKVYNDKNGHLAGDKCLKQVTEIINNNVRKTDFVARYGGEEFALILPATNKFGAYRVIEKIRQEIESYSFEFGFNQPQGRLTISTGISNLPEDADEVRELISLADKSLYKGKEIGRNTVVLYKAGLLLEKENINTVV
jgi:diguanylate cyclase (GGDEF)-like protein